jgi:hypothetical protein
MWCQNCGAKVEATTPMMVWLTPVEDEEDVPLLHCCADCLPVVCERRDRVEKKLLPWFAENFTQGWVKDGDVLWRIEWVWKW